MNSSRKNILLSYRAFVKSFYLTVQLMCFDSAEMVFCLCFTEFASNGDKHEIYTKKKNAYTL